MPKNLHIIPILAFLLLIGATSLAMGAPPAMEDTSKQMDTIGTLTATDVPNIDVASIPDGSFPATVNNITAKDVGIGNNRKSFSFADLNVTLPNGQTKEVVAVIRPGTTEEINMYNTLINSAFLASHTVQVEIKKFGNIEVITSVTFEVP